jgi:hypothetical protein
VINTEAAVPQMVHDAEVALRSCNVARGCALKPHHSLRVVIWRALVSVMVTLPEHVLRREVASFGRLADLGQRPLRSIPLRDRRLLHLSVTKRAAAGRDHNRVRLALPTLAL